MNETKYTVKFTTVFRKDYKKAKKRRLPLEKLKEVVDLLAMGQPLPERNRDHALTGDWVGQHRYAQRTVWVTCAVWGNLYGGFFVLGLFFARLCV